MIESQWFLRTNTGFQCSLCPHECNFLGDGTGICGVRTVVKNQPVLPFAGLISSIALDPIEKKPLFHYHPGKRIASIGFLGCNMRCPFCQNHVISQNLDHKVILKTPQQISQLAIYEKSFGIAYTYSEPLIHYEFLTECMLEARNHGLKNILVSNACINTGPWTGIVPFIDAANIDLKSFDKNWYKTELGGDLETIKENIRFASRFMHLEITTLVIPGKNDSRDEILEIASFIASISPSIPWHITAYHPAWKYSIQSTNSTIIETLANEARRYLTYVYEGTIISRQNDTVCQTCTNILVSRYGYSIQRQNYNISSTGTLCLQCGKPTPIIDTH